MDPRLDIRQERSLDSYAHAIRGHAGLVAVAMLAALLGGLVFLAVREPQYQATARVLIDPASADDEGLIGLPLVRDAGDPTRTAQTAAALLESPSAATVTAERIGRPWTTRSVLNTVTIEPAGQSNILAVTATADSPESSARLANTFTGVTLAERDARLLAAVQAELEPASAGAPTDETPARTQQLETLRRSGDPTVGLADEALPPDSASGTAWWLVLALALLSGAVVGAVAAVVADMRSPRRLSGEDELLELMPEPILARLPEGWQRFHSRPGMHDPTAADVAFRSLEVQLSLFDGGARTVMVSSPGEDDGKTTLLASLALRLASEGQRVVVMDLDLHTPALADLLGVPVEPGLAGVLEPGGSLADGLVSVLGIPELAILPGMEDTRLAALAAARQRLPRLIAEARESGAHVLIDTAPIGTVGDALLLLDGVDELLLVARVGHTKTAAIEATRDALRRAARTPSGFVVIGDELLVTEAAEPWRRLLGELGRPAEAAARDDGEDAGANAQPEPAEPVERVDEFAPGDRVRWTRGAARGSGTVQRRLPAPVTSNGQSPSEGDDEPRYVVVTDRTGRELACRASALSNRDEGG